MAKQADNELDAVADVTIEAATLGEFRQLAGGFWRGRTRLKAWGLTAAVFLLAFAELGVQLGLNHWNGWFFNALERKDADAIYYAVFVFAALAAAAIVLAILGLLARMLFQTHWRAWLTQELLALWIGEKRLVRLTNIAHRTTNPEYRIADDVRFATEPVAEFATGIVVSLAMAATFIAILWNLGGAAPLPGTGVVVPGHMVVAVFVYAAVNWSMTWVIGRPQVQRIKERNEAEARFRHDLMRLNARAPDLSEARLEGPERRRVEAGYGAVVRAWVRLAYQTSYMMSLVAANSVLASVIPLLLMAPKYLAGEVPLGTVMQVSLAFVQVQAALNWAALNYTRIAEWYASVSRVVALEEALEEMG